MSGINQLGFDDSEVMSADSDWDEWQRFVIQAKEAASEGNHSFAEFLWSAAVDAAELQKTDLRLPLSLDGLAEAFWNQGKLRQSENTAKRAFQLYSQLLPHDHMDLAISAYNLAMIFHWQQKYGQAEPLYKKALEIKTKHLGGNHPEVINVLTQYAKLLNDTHREAEAAHLKVCIDGATTGKWARTTMQVLPFDESSDSAPAHHAPSGQPRTAAHQTPSSSNQGVLSAQAQQAATNRSLSQNQPQSPQTAHSNEPPAHTGLDNQAIGRLAPTLPQGANSKSQAKPLEEAKRGAPPPPPPAIYKNTLAKAKGKGDALLAELDFLRGKVAEYEAIIKKQNEQIQDLMAQALRKTSEPEFLPPTNTPSRTDSMTWDNAMKSARRAFDESNFDEAHTLLQQALSLASEAGEQSSQFSITLDALGECLFRQEKYGQAEMMWQRSLNIKRQYLGTFHRDVAQTADKLARLHYHMSRFQEAEFLANKCIEIYTQVSGPKSLEVAASTHNLATLYHVQGKYAHAEKAYKQAIDIRVPLLGAQHPETATLMRNYADLLAATGRTNEAQRVDDTYTGVVTGSWKVIKIDPDQQLGE